jgi:hypothetical protein
MRHDCSWGVLSHGRIEEKSNLKTKGPQGYPQKLQANEVRYEKDQIFVGNLLCQTKMGKKILGRIVW